MAETVRGAEELQRLANALKDAADNDLQKQVSAAFRSEAKPLGMRVLARGAMEMPHRGGLAARVAGLGRVGVSASLRGRVASVQVILRNKGANLKSMDAGIVRHPVYGNRGVWVAQRVPEGAFRRAVDAEATEVAAKAQKAAEAVLDDVARKA